MQPYYGDEPHIIQKHAKNRRSYGSRYAGSRAQRFRIFIVLAIFTIIPVVATYALLSKVEVAVGKTYCVKAETRYFLVTGSYDVISDANLAAAIVKEKGGAGYVFNDGKFRIVAAAYKDKRTAEAVSERQKSETEIYPITINKTLLGSDKSVAKQLTAALNVCYEVFTDLTAVTEEYEKGNSTDGALSLAVTNAVETLRKTSREITEVDATGLIGEYLDVSSANLSSAVTDEAYTFSVRVRGALCALIYERHLLSLKLPDANPVK